jgi:hypothetical protein
VVYGAAKMISAVNREEKLPVLMGFLWAPVIALLVWFSNFSIAAVLLAAVYALAMSVWVLLWIMRSDIRTIIFSRIVGTAINLAILYFLVRFVKWAWYR